tara:strand:+ start:174 stop:1259 length:1086 start_codon:yes stop_codon:yes gene_type:complete
MTIDKVKILKALESINVYDEIYVNHPSILKGFHIENLDVNLDLVISNPSLQFKNKLKKDIENTLLNIYSTAQININIAVEKIAKSHPTASIKNIIAVASGKGGVGKSTVSSNLAIAFTKKGYKVGLIDADIYGPSIPLMFDAESERPKVIEKDGTSLISPIISYGVKIMSIGFFSDPSEAIVWRGPMATKALKQIINQTDWGPLDYLFIDLPPGTGDVHLSLVQTIALTGSIIVTTPQPVALIDAKKAISMFKMKEINVPIIGLVENMSWFNAKEDKHYIFGRDGGKNISNTENIELLMELPLNQSIREAGDVGRPAALQESSLGNIFIKLAEAVEKKVNLMSQSSKETKKVEIKHNRGCN